MVQMWLYEIIPLSMIVYSFRFSSENYDNMPEKIPVHFGIRGKADAWKPKTRFWAYLIPIVDLVSFALVAGIELITLRGGSSVVFFASFLLVNLPLRLLLLCLNIGMVHYALGKTNNIWKYMGVPLALLLLCAAIMAVFLPRHIEKSKKHSEQHVLEAQLISHRIDRLTVLSRCSLEIHFPGPINSISHDM